MAQQRIIILGAGLLGRLLAFELAKADYSVDIYERGTNIGEGSAAYAAAAMLAPLAESVATEPSIVKMGYYSIPRWKSIIDQLHSDIFFQQNGSLLVWHSQDASSAKHFENQLQHIYQQQPDIPHYRYLEHDQLQEIEPGLSSNLRNGIFLPGEAQLDNRALLISLLAQSEFAGASYHWKSPCDAMDFDESDYDWLIDCRGLGARKELSQLRGVRGEVIRVYAPEVELQRPTRLIHPKYPLYIAPKKDHLYVIGATEIESEDNSPISVRSALEMLSAAYSIHSGFAEARILETNAQCRPTFSNNLPMLEEHPGRVISVNGLYRHGYLISPAVIDSLMEIIQHGTFLKAQSFDLTHKFVSHENIC